MTLRDAAMAACARRLPRFITLLAAATVAIAVAPPSTDAQNVDSGRQTFRQICSACHEAVAGRNRIGPSLFGVVGRKAGTVPEFHYSDGMRTSGLTLDEATLDRFLSGPRSVVAGTKMPYAGMKDDRKRHDLIAYLATLH